MQETLAALPILAVAIFMNIAAGTYYNIGVQDLSFNKRKLVNGLIKAAIVTGLFVGTSFCFDRTDLSSLGVTPQFIMNTAIVLYVGKALVSLGKIVGVEVTLK